MAEVEQLAQFGAELAPYGNVLLLVVLWWLHKADKKLNRVSWEVGLIRRQLGMPRDAAERDKAA